MQKILNQEHSKFTFIYALSRLIERAAYYGLRTLIVLYMISETLKLSREEALSIYGFITASLVFSQILGAIIGDLILNNKKALIIGNLLQALGAFTLCLNTTNSLYIGLGLMVLGGGLFTPNIIAHFGKIYLNKTKLLDSGFTLFYVAINIGSFLGVILIGYVGEKFGWNYGFILAGILFILSVLFPFLSKEQTPSTLYEKSLSINRRVLNIFVAFIIVGLFWAIYEVSSIRMFGLQMDFRNSSSVKFPSALWDSLNFYCIVPIGVLLVFLWSKYYSSQFIKLTVGFIFLIISLGTLFLIPEIPSENHTYLYIVSIILLSLSELHIAPIINSILTQFTNPKYLAIITSLAFVPTRIITFVIAFFSNDYFYDNPIIALKIALFATVIITLGLIIFILINKNYLQQSTVVKN